MFSRFAKFALVASALAAATPAWAQIDGTNNTDAYSAVMGAGKNASLVSRLRQVPSVGVINVGYGGPSARDDDESGQLRMIALRNGTAVHALRHALAANPVTRRALAANNVDIGNVIGVQVGATGSLRVFTE